MAYTKQTWECGDTITADKLNHMEDGIEECCGGGSAPLIVEVVEYTPTCEPGCTPRSGTALSATWQDMKDAIDEGRNVYFLHEQTVGGLTANVIEPLDQLVWVEGTRYATFFRSEAFDTETPTEMIVVTPGSCDCGPK